MLTTGIPSYENVSVFCQENRFLFRTYPVQLRLVCIKASLPSGSCMVVLSLYELYIFHTSFASYSNTSMIGVSLISMIS